MILEFLVLFGVMLLAMAIGVPIFLSLGMSAAAYVLIFWPKVPLMVIAQGFVHGVESYSLVAIPLFFLAGEIMNAGGINDRLMRFARACLGHVRGGLSHVNICASMVFAGVSGSALADASAVGSVMIPAMKRGGYPAAYAAAVTAASSVIGPIIPPSIPMVMFGMYAMVSVGKLFIAGVVPGLLMGIFLMAAASIVARRRNYPSTEWSGWKELRNAFIGSWSALAMPLIVILGIVGGIATVTEVAAIAAAYALIVSLAYRQASPRALWRACVRAAVDSCRVLIIISICGLFIWIIGNMGAARIVADSLLAITKTPMILLAIMAAFLLVASTVIEGVVLLIVFVPLMIPAARLVGIDLIHMGVVTVLATLIGLILPPIGILIYVTATQAGARAYDVVVELVPFIIALVLLLAFLIVFPQLSLWLPGLLFK